MEHFGVVMTTNMQLFTDTVPSKCESGENIYRIYSIFQFVGLVMFK